MTRYFMISALVLFVSLDSLIARAEEPAKENITETATDTATANKTGMESATETAAESSTEAATKTASESETAKEPEKEKVERIEVTGSHIRRLDVEGTSPIVTLNRKDLEKSGYNSVADVLRNTTGNSFGAAKEASGSNAAGNAEVNLRGLGSSNTLVLLNGQRLPTDAVTGAVDLNLVPMAAIERVEILKDGASAIYGSDALGGVVNIITRKDFQGSEISLSKSVTSLKGGDKEEISLVNGINRESFNIVTVLQYRNNKPIYARDRSWSANSSPSTIGNPGGYQNASGGPWYADPNCPADQISHTSGGDFCTFNASAYMTSLPTLQQLSLLSEANFELSSKLKMVARIGGTQKKVQWSYAAAPGIFTIPGSVADHLGPGGTALPGANPGEDLTVRYRLTELGTRDTQVTTHSYNLLVGGTYLINNDWQVDTTVAHNSVDTKDVGVNGYALTQSIADKISQGQYNPFASAGQKGSLEDTRYQPEEILHSQLSSLEIKTSGSFGEMAAGPIGVALGTNFTFQKYADIMDEKSVNGEVFGNAGSSGGGLRNTRAIFTEFSLPVSSKFEVQIAGRYDHYSDFGDASNPKLGLLYHVTPSFLLRASAGTGFKAPLMQDLYAATSDGNPTFIDAVACANGHASECQPKQHNVISGGNQNLAAEKSISYNVGAVYEPNQNFNIGTDFFYAKMRNVVDINYNDLTRAERDGVNLAQYGVIVHRTSGLITSVEAPLQNLASQEISGFDLSTSYTLHKVKLSVDHAHMFYFKEEGFPGGGLTNTLDEIEKPAWKNTTAVTYFVTDEQELKLAALTIAGTKQAVKNTGRLNDYTELELHYAYKTKSTGTFSLGVKNLFGTTPPLDSSNPGDPLNEEIYDQIGTQFIAGYKVNF